MNLIKHFLTGIVATIMCTATANADLSPYEYVAKNIRELSKLCNDMADAYSACKGDKLTNKLTLTIHNFREKIHKLRQQSHEPARGYDPHEPSITHEDIGYDYYDVKDSQLYKYWKEVCDLSQSLKSELEVQHFLDILRYLIDLSVANNYYESDKLKYEVDSLGRIMILSCILNIIDDREGSGWEFPFSTDGQRCKMFLKTADKYYSE